MVSAKQQLRPLPTDDADVRPSAQSPTPIVPNALFDEEDQEHNHTIWGLSDGTDGPKGGWSKGDDPLEYLTDPEPLGGPASAPAPDPALFGTYSPVQDLKGTVKSQAKSAAQKVTKKKTKK